MEEESQYQKWKARLVAELRAEAPALLKVLGTASELELTIQRTTIECDGHSLRGRVATLIAQDFFAAPRTNSATRGELKRTGPDVNSGGLSRELNALVALGLLTHEPSGYQVAPNAKVRVRHSNGSSARAT